MKMTCYYNAKVKKGSTCIGNLTLMKAFFSLKEPNISTLGPNWEARIALRKNYELGLEKVKTWMERPTLSIKYRASTKILSMRKAYLFAR